MGATGRVAANAAMRRPDVPIGVMPGVTPGVTPSGLTLYTGTRRSMLNEFDVPWHIIVSCDVKV